MTRGINAATLAQIEADAANIIYFIELEIDLTASPQETLRLHSGLGTITWGSKAWTGAGSLLGIESVQETNKLNPAPLRASLSGVDSSVTNIVFNTNYYRKPCKLYLGALSDGVLVADPSLIFSGFIEKMDMVLGGDNGDIVEMTAESEFILFKRTRNVRYTDRQLQSEYSGDLGFEFLEFVATSKITWRGQNNPMGSDGAWHRPRYSRGSVHLSVSRIVSQWNQKPFERGLTDCCAFVDHVVVGLTGESLIPQYHDDATAGAIIERYGSLKNAVTHYMGREPIPANQLQPGDVVLVEMFEHQAIGVLLETGSVACVFEYSGLREIRADFVDEGWPIGR